MGVVENTANWPLGAPFAVCVVLVVLYALGGRGRPRDVWWRTACFYAGVAVIIVALDTPIDSYADRLFWVHMVQHVLLLTVAPPLLVLGRPWPRMWQPLPVSVRRGAARVFVLGAPIAKPAVALVLMSATLAFWHIPTFWNAALRNNYVHQLEHVMFVVTAILFWAPVLGAPPLRARLDGAVRCVYIVAAMVPGWILSMVLAFSPKPIYAYAQIGHRPGGLSAIADQQLAAGIMWVPGSLVYIVAACWALYLWLDPSATRQHRPAVQH